MTMSFTSPSDKSAAHRARPSDDRPTEGVCTLVKSEHLSRRKCRLNARNGDAVILLAGTEYDRGADIGGHDLSHLQTLALSARARLSAAACVVETDEDMLVWMVRMAQESPTFSALLSDAAESGWRVMLSDLGTGTYDYDFEQKIIELDHQGLNPSALSRSSFFRHELLINFLCVLRAVEQEQAAETDITDLKPEAYVMARRAVEADIITMAILTGWELRAAGHADVWRHVIGGDQGDMAMVFLKSLERDPSAVYSGRALARVFAAWYTDDRRVAACDHAALEDLDVLIDEEGAAGLGDRPLTGAWVEDYAVLPDGMAYLEGQGADIASAPDYCAIRDSINETHLFQVVYDSKVVSRGGVPFRDAALARKIFPQT